MKSEIADFAEHIFGVIPVAVKLKDVTIVGQKLLEGIDAFVRSKLRVRNREIKEDEQTGGLLTIPISYKLYDIYKDKPKGLH